ncbi:hypothetical protein [Flaviaesturariibacter aridisoli]|uniref:hypothetical protein n=1 Tax=Flaviaesturariibacter aridisoli TaxID=2545761 RepID=UPI001404C2DF|nr:hypothetical protein [Flaviaesturariibacter aridisoli]
MDKTPHVRKPEQQPLTLVPKQEPRPLTVAYHSEQEILALQEKARLYGRSYPVGGYQGL